MSSILNVGEIRADAWKNSDGTENYKCRAWVNFNGTGTPAIRASGNVSSITDNGTGDYTINFSTAMLDIKYAVNLTSADYSAAAIYCPRVKSESASGDATLKSTTQVRIMCAYNGSFYDYSEVYASIFR